MPDQSKHAPARQPDQPDWWTSDEWATPPAFVEALEAEFGRFDLDPCAREATAKAEYFYTLADDGLAQAWFGQVFVNPPYSKPGPWVEKAIAETRRDPSIRVRLLLPAATDVGWFHDLVLVHANVRFIRGRLRFLGWHGRPVGSPTAGNILVSLPRVADRRFHL